MLLNTILRVEAFNSVHMWVWFGEAKTAFSVRQTPIVRDQLAQTHVVIAPAGFDKEQQSYTVKYQIGSTGLYRHVF